MKKFIIAEDLIRAIAQLLVHSVSKTATYAEQSNILRQLETLSPYEEPAKQEKAPE